MTAETTKPAYEGWALVELMGHRQTAGQVTEVEMAGTKVFRVDTPGQNGEPVATQFYSGSAIYCLTPCSEQVARQFLDSRPYNLPPAIELALSQPETPRIAGPDHDGDEDDGYGDDHGLPV